MGQNLHFWVNYPFNFSNELLQYFKMSKKKNKAIEFTKCIHCKNLLGCFNPTLGQIWTNPDIWLNF